MTANQLKIVSAFEDGLKVGDPATVCWTNSGHRFTGKGNVTKINTKSFMVTLSQDVPITKQEKYPTGQKIIVPRIDNIRLWTTNNRIEPPDGYRE